MMKKLFLLLITMLSALGVKAIEDMTFEYEYQGQTIIYEVISTNQKTCRLATLPNPSDQEKPIPENSVSGKLVLPAHPVRNGEEYTLTLLGPGALSDQTELTYVEIPETVIQIDRYLFSGCTNLETVIIPEGVESLGYGAFFKCASLTSIELPESLTSIGGTSFRDCRALKSVNIKGAVRSIPSYCFYFCFELESVILPETVKSIGDNAFEADSKLASFNLPEGVTYIGRSAFNGCKLLPDIDLPPALTTLGEQAFYGCQLIRSITIPGSLTVIPNRAFYECTSLEEVTFPEGLTKIGSSAFYGCTALNSAILPSTVTQIGASAFSRCSSLEIAELPESLDVLNDYVFNKCSNLRSINIPASITSIGNYALYESMIESVVIPAGVTRIGQYAFGSCRSIKSITVKSSPSTSTVIVQEAFDCCTSLSELILEEGVEVIGKYAFYNCSSLVSVIIPKSVTTIKEYAFCNCKKLTSFVLCGNVTSMTTNAFNDGTALKRFAYPNNMSAPYYSGVVRVAYDPNGAIVEDGWIYGPDKKEIRYAPYELTDAVEIPSSITSVAANAFNGCTGITSVVIPGSIASIGEQAFSGCKALSSVEYLAETPITANSNVFDNGTYSTATLYALDKANPQISTTEPWSKFVTKDLVVLTVNPSPAEVTLGETVQLTAGYSAEVSDTPIITWTSSDEGVATVDARGLVTGVAVGKVIITAEDQSGLEATCELTVNPVLATGITLDETEKVLVKGGTLQLVATIDPETTTDKSIIWTSSDEAVATVDENGLVTAISPGETAIKATTSNGVEATCVVTVVILADGITLNKPGAELVMGTTLQLEATIDPETTTDKSVTWTSSDEAVATVDENGLVSAIAPGEAVITAATSNGVEATCVVTVIILADGITLNKPEAELVMGTTLQLEATIDPETTTDKSITWTSSEEAVATVDENGLVTAVAPGDAVITATTSNGKEATCTVTVVILADGITLNKPEAELVMGTTLQLEATIDPETTTDKSITWASSEEAVATVDEKGLVTAVAPGDAVITATTSNGKEATCTVTVVILADGITLNKPEAELVMGTTLQLEATIDPETTTDKSITWASSEEAVATVDENGLVTAVAPGEAVITATTSNGVEATCTVTVIILADGITLNKPEAELVMGTTLQLEATIDPETTTDKSITWTSSDEDVAIVDEKGLVTAVAPGEAVITATTSNGVEATCVVTVVILADGITLNKPEAELVMGTTLQLEATIDPETTTDKSITWTSSDESVATVDETGLVSAIASGKAVITATTSNGKEATCTVTVIILADGITLNKPEVELVMGTTLQLEATIDPETATDKSITWTSSDESVATVDEKGLVTAVAQGKALITATTSNGKEATCTVTVIILADGITLNEPEAELVMGTTLQLETTIDPETTTDKSITWTSSDESVATVDENGIVAAIAPGKTVITATTSNGKEATCTVTVIILADGITLNEPEAELVMGTTIQLEATIDPETTTDKSITWTSSDESVATVDEKGLVTAIAPGKAVITATTANGKKATCVVTVVILADGITLNEPKAELVKGSTLQLEAFILPEGTTDKSVTWTSSDEVVATVDETGLVTAIAPGKAVITATTANGKKSTCTVTVVILADGITLNETESELVKGTTLQLETTIDPETTTDKSVTWTSSDEAVATVDETGLVTAIAPGKVTITATTANGKKATCTVTVVILADGIALNEPMAELVKGMTLQLEAVILPEVTTDKSVTWTSSDESVATVDETGLVTAIAPGKAVITATTTNGKKATCTVTIVILADGITLNETESELVKGTTLQLEATIDPETTTDKSVTWTSSDEAVATVDETGLVTAIAPGNVTITATTANGKKATCTVNVVILADGITLNETESELVKGTTLQLEATIDPETTTDKSITWTSSDEAVATVDETGLVTAIAPGKVTITATTANGKKATCTVTVVILADGIALNMPEAELVEGETLQLEATIDPETTTDKSVTWTSSDESVATVDGTGLVTAIAPGEVTITAMTTNGKEAACELVVAKRIIPVEMIILDQTEATIAYNETLQLTATVVPDNATDKAVVWTSSDETVATVSETGLVTALLPGNVTITATSVNNLTAICELTVTGFTGIDGIYGTEVLRIDGNTVIAPEGSRIYNVSGRLMRFENLEKGIYIVVLPEGKNIKIAIR